MGVVVRRTGELVGVSSMMAEMKGQSSSRAHSDVKDVEYHREDTAGDDYINDAGDNRGRGRIADRR